MSKRVVMAIVTTLVATGCEGSWGSWQAEQIGARAAAPVTRSGDAVAVSSDRAAFSAVLEDGTPVVDVFRYDGGALAWVFLQRILKRPVNAEPRFGAGLAMEGEDLLIGGARNPSGVVPGPLPAGARLGYVDHYRFTGGAYGYVTTFAPVPPASAGDPSSGNQFGSTLDVANGVVVVGAPKFNDTVGAAFAFDLTTHAQTGFLQEVDRPFFSEKNFGAVVRTSGGRIAVGQPRYCAGARRPCKSQVFIYELRGGAWTMVEKLESPAAIPGDGSTYTDSFGGALAIDGDWLGIAESVGRKVYVYNRAPKATCVSPPCWNSVQQIALGGDVQSQGMALSQSVLMWGEPRGGRRVDSGGAITGILRFFRRSGATLAPEGELVMPTTGFGAAVDLDGPRFVSSTSLPTVAAVFGSHP